MKNEKLTMKELPSADRPYERAFAYGSSALSDTELIAVLLKTGSGSDNALTLAARLLKRFEGRRPLSDLFFAEAEELTRVKGIGKVKAITLKCAGELAFRISKETAAGNLCLESSDSIAAYFMESMRHLPYEQIRAAFFDTKSHLLKDVVISTGTVNASIISPREVFLAALKYRAVFVVLLHNHPSGDPKPSPEDLIFTNQIKKAGEILQIPLLDHIIIGDNRFVSLRKQGVL